MTTEEAQKIRIEFTCRYEGLLSDILLEDDLEEIHSIKDVELYLVDCSDYLVDISEKHLTIEYDNTGN